MLHDFEIYVGENKFDVVYEPHDGGSIDEVRFNGRLFSCDGVFVPYGDSFIGLLHYLTEEAFLAYESLMADEAGLVYEARW